MRSKESSKENVPPVKVMFAAKELSNSGHFDRYEIVSSVLVSRENKEAPAKKKK